MSTGAITDGPALVARPFEQGRFEDLPRLPRVAHPYYGAETEEVVVASRRFGRTRVHVVSYGSPHAPPLLLLHGLMTSSYSWRYLLEPLSDRFRLVAPDLPGAGRSEPAPGRRHSMEALAALVGELQEALDIEGCPAVGNSLGGSLCLLRALDDPSSFERLVAVHPPVVPDARIVALNLALRVPGVASILARVARHDPLRWAHRNVHYYDESLKSLEEAHEYGDPLASAAGAREFTRYLGETLNPHDMRTLMRTLERRRDAGEAFPIPLSLVYAREDPTVSPSNGAKLHELVPDAELHWLDRSSHFAQVDSPARLARLVEDFVDGP